ncbi:receptor-like protein Cf-9 homolog [Syzygium oleosum]|uniref:receptor-like protein Cf-9 homolog n=1 Tax=Syzygium oleosum TaxID=219896 RepID=UPI0024BA634F|nr:receptor-like protein Cf-9 homolog [Syzygium oleosum]
MTTWKNGLDCCTWDGLACDNVTGNVIGLDLSFSCLEGTLRSNSSLFALHHLQSLNLAENNFRTSPILPELSLFTELNHLDLSRSNFSGLVPVEISYLSKLVLLDLSFNLGLQIENTGFKRLVQNFTELRELNLDYIDMSAVSPSSFVNLSSSLTYFSMYWCYLRGELPPNIFSLPNLLHLSLDFNFIKISFPKSNWSKSLESLTLSDASISGKIPDSIGESKNLKTLYLSYCTLTGSIPSSLVNLTKLTRLDFSHSELTGHIPSFVGKLARLIYLDLSFNNFTGVLDLGVLSTLKNLQVLRLTVELNLAYHSTNDTFPKLETLALPSCNLTKFPIFLKSLKRITELDLSKNKIGGEIPRWFWDVGEGRLLVLDISSNLIEGGIQQFPWKELTIVDLSDNLFQGPLPIPPLSILLFWASENGFSGEIPSSICELSSPEILLLARNNLSGSIPQCLGNLTNLFALDLSANQLEGTLPRFLDNCALLFVLNVGFNKINDTFPKWLLEAPSLESIDLQFNEFHGQIDLPAAPFLPSRLNSFSISNNNLGGQWPEEYFLHRLNMWKVDLSNNRFEGPLPIPPPATQFYSIANNKIGGKVSSLICNATELIVVDLSNNSLMGTLPECLMSFSKYLSVLNLRMNMIQGVIPIKFAKGSNLRTIDFSRNRFEGTLPRSLVHCDELEVLDLGNNGLKDTFPDWLGTLPKLQVLVLRSNMFHGFVSSPRAAPPFSELRIFDLSNNNLSGPLPVRYIMKFTAMMNRDNGQGKLQYMGGDGYEDSVTVTIKGLEIQLVKILTVFTSIDLSSNHFGGELPVDIGNLKSLKGLNFSHNNLTGYIPRSIGNLTELEWLDLSSNKFSGRIPRELADLTSLEILNLSENQLIGPIPLGRQFNTFKSDSFVGNPGLCGFPLPGTCTNNSREIPPLTILEGNDTEHGGWFEWRAILMGYGCGIVAGVSLGYIVLESKKFGWLAGLLERKGANMRKKRRRNARRSY